MLNIMLYAFGVCAVLATLGIIARRTRKPQRLSAAEMLHNDVYGIPLNDAVNPD